MVTNIIKETVKQLFDINQLEKDVLNFRTEQEKYHEWDEYKSCFSGMCQDVTKELEKYLIDLGYNANRIRGYYSGADSEYYPDMKYWDWEEKEEFIDKWEQNGDSSEGFDFPHWWVVVNKKYIVDVTEDQFHPEQEDDYRVGIYTIPHRNYKKWR